MQVQLCTALVLQARKNAFGHRIGRNTCNASWVFVTPFVQAVQGNADDSPEQEGLGATLPLLAERECTQTV